MVSRVSYIYESLHQNLQQSSYIKNKVYFVYIDRHLFETRI